MKKIISLILAAVMILSMGATAFAVDVYAGSVNLSHGAISARIINESGEAIEVLELGDDCLIVTHITEIDKAHEEVTEEAKHLKDVYEKLLSGELVPDYRKAGFNPSNMVIIDLYDATLICEDHPELIDTEGVLIEITFKVKVDAGKDVCVMAYKNNEWIPAERVINSGNNTVTIVMEHLCPIVFAVDNSDGSSGSGIAGGEANPNTGSSVALGMVAIVSAAAAAFSFKRK